MHRSYRSWLIRSCLVHAMRSSRSGRIIEYLGHRSRGQKRLAGNSSRVLHLRGYVSTNLAHLRYFSNSISLRRGRLILRLTNPDMVHRHHHRRHRSTRSANCRGHVGTVRGGLGCVRAACRRSTGRPRLERLGSRIQHEFLGVRVELRLGHRILQLFALDTLRALSGTRGLLGRIRHTLLSSATTVHYAEIATATVRGSPSAAMPLNGRKSLHHMRYHLRRFRA